MFRPGEDGLPCDVRDHLAIDTYYHADGDAFPEITPQDPLPNYNACKALNDAEVIRLEEMLGKHTSAETQYAFWQRVKEIFRDWYTSHDIQWPKEGRELQHDPIPEPVEELGLVREESIDVDRHHELLTVENDLMTWRGSLTNLAYVLHRLRVCFPRDKFASNSQYAYYWYKRIKLERKGKVDSLRRYFNELARQEVISNERQAELEPIIKEVVSFFALQYPHPEWEE